MYRAKLDRSKILERTKCIRLNTWTEPGPNLVRNKFVRVNSIREQNHRPTFCEKHSSDDTKICFGHISATMISEGLHRAKKFPCVLILFFIYH